MNAALFRRPLSDRAQCWSFAALLAIGYVLFYGWLLVRSGGFPYVLDNNESFSSLWHASNMYHFGFEHVFGLTDEAYGFSAAAHPYVYTHQGNFPRIPAFFFYALGARSIESQILVTTFTVGLAAVFLAYRFLGQLTKNWTFSALACAIIFSDYVLVAQWQVVTYRVWHAFFFFATLQCVHAIEGPKPVRASLILLVNVVCLFYFELVFAAFVATFASLYALFLNLRNIRRVIRIVVVLAVGCAIGAGVLCLQIILYMGWDNFLKDLTYTYVARNQFTDSETMVETLRGFFDSNHIVFWYNLVDASSFRTPLHLGASILYYELQPHTPYFILLLFIPAIGYWASRREVFSVGNRAQSQGRERATRLLTRLAGTIRRCAVLAVALVLPVLLVGAHLLQRAFKGEFGAVQVATLVLSVPLILFAYMRMRSGKATLEQSMSIASMYLLFCALPSVFQYTYWVWTQLGALSLPLKAFVGSYVFLIGWNFHRGLAPSSERYDAGTRRRILVVAVFFATTVVLAVILVGSPFALGWRPLGDWLRGNDLVLAAIGTMVSYVAIARYSGTREHSVRGWLLPGPTVFVSIDRAWRFNLVLIGVFVVQSFAFNQAYQPIWEAVTRQVLPEPFLRLLMLLSVLLAHILLQVGHEFKKGEASDGLLPKVGVFVLAGYLAYVVVYLLSPGYVFTGYRFRLAPFSIFITDVVIACGIWLVIRATKATFARFRLNPTLGLLIGLLPLCFWFPLQFAQVSLMPPEQFTALKYILSSPPYRGSSFVSNMYAAPVAAFTGQWAYIDAELAEAKVVNRDGHRQLKTDDRYLWLADRATNPDYARPQYFLCLVPQSLPSLAAKLKKDRGDGEGYPGCADMGLVKFANSKQDGVLPHAKLVAIDEQGKKTYGYSTWAIVKLDWGP